MYKNERPPEESKSRLIPSSVFRFGCDDCSHQRKGNMNSKELKRNRKCKTSERVPNLVRDTLEHPVITNCPTTCNENSNFTLVSTTSDTRTSGKINTNIVSNNDIKSSHKMFYYLTRAHPLLTVHKSNFYLLVSLVILQLSSTCISSGAASPNQDVISEPNDKHSLESRTKLRLPASHEELDVFATASSPSDYNDVNSAVFATNLDDGIDVNDDKFDVILAKKKDMFHKSFHGKDQNFQFIHNKITKQHISSTLTKNSDKSQNIHKKSFNHKHKYKTSKELLNKFKKSSLEGNLKHHFQRLHHNKNSHSPEPATKILPGPDTDSVEFFNLPGKMKTAQDYGAFEDLISNEDHDLSPLEIQTESPPSPDVKPVYKGKTKIVLAVEF